MRSLIFLIFVILSVDGKKPINPSYEDLYVYSTDEAVVHAKPVVINARKMSHAMKHQDVVSTCRYILFKTFQTWNQAEANCKKIPMPITHTNASLAVIKTREDNLDITHLLQLAYGVKRVGRKFDRRNWVWVGLRKVLNNDKKLKKKERGPDSFNASEWRWADGSIPEYSRWMRDMPDQDNEGKHRFQNHVSVNKRGRWDDSFSYKEMPYACNYCGKYIVINRHVTWHHAQRLCKSYGLTFAKVDSKRDNDDLNMAAIMAMGEQPEPKRWNDTNWIWIGTMEVLDQDGVGTSESDVMNMYFGVWPFNFLFVLLSIAISLPLIVAPRLK